MRTDTMTGLARHSAVAGVLMLAGCAAAQTASEPIVEVTPPVIVERAPTAVELSTFREETIDELLTLSKSAYPQVRANAIEALAESPARVSDVVGDRLLDSNEGVRAVAAMVAGRLRLSEHVDRLETLTSDSSPHVRASAIYALRACGLDADPSPLADLLLGHDNPRVRAHVAFVLGEMGDRSALGPLRQASAAPMRRADRGSVRLMRLQMAEAMVKLGDDAQLSVIRAALYPARPEELEAAALAVQILGEVEDRAVIDQLIELAKGADETERAMPAEVRLASAAALAQMGLAQGTYVADAYRDHDMDVLRAQAASVYGDARRVSDVPKLNHLRRDGSEMVRVAACGAILKIAGGSGSRADADRRNRGG